MPLPPSIRLGAVIDAIDPAKDIDGIHPLNAGLLRLGYDGFLPATAHAAVEILRRSGIEIEGRRAVVVGRSAVVGMPAAFLLVRENATVTVCHSRTRDLQASREGRRDPRRRGRPARAHHRARCSGAAPSSSTSGSTSWTASSSATSTSSRRGGSRPRSRRCRAASGPLTNALLLAHLVRAAQAQADAEPGAAAPSRTRASVGKREPAAHQGSHMTFPSDLEIARSVTPRPDRRRRRTTSACTTTRSSSTAGRRPRSRSRGSDGSRPSGPAASTSSSPRSRPTPLGEGKSTTTVGLAQGLNRIGHKAAVCIRQPSLGPVFGIKGGAAGGGYSQVIPMEDFNLHLTGDVHAIGAAHNLAAAFLDNQPPPRQPARHRPVLDPLAAGRRHQRPGGAARGHRPRRQGERRPPRDRVA